MTSPLRGPKSPEGGGFAATHLPARRAGYGAAPPASRVLRIALRATALRAALDPGDHCGPWGQEERAGPGLPPRCARRANPRRSPASASTRIQKETDELAFDTQKAENNRYHSQALESVKHHLKPNRQRSVGPRQTPRASTRRSGSGRSVSGRLVRVKGRDASRRSAASTARLRGPGRTGRTGRTSSMTSPNRSSSAEKASGLSAGAGGKKEPERTDQRPGPHASTPPFCRSRHRR